MPGGPLEDSALTVRVPVGKGSGGYRGNMCMCTDRLCVHIHVSVYQCMRGTGQTYSSPSVPS